MQKFNIGDVIVPQKATPYSITAGKDTVLKVTDTREDEEDIRVEVIKHMHSSSIGDKYWVSSKYFDYKYSTKDEVFLDSL